MMDLLLARRRMMMPHGDHYLTFTANTAGSTIAMQAFGNAPAVSLEYSVDGGVTWQPFVVGSTTVTLANVGDAVKMRGVNARIGGYGNDGNRFVMTGSIAASGDMTSVINGVGGNATIVIYCFRRVFQGCSALTAAPDLPSTNVNGTGTYSHMFRGCTSLVQAPRIGLASASSVDVCFAMFYGCTSLEVAPDLNVKTLASGMYSQMFYGCSSLRSIRTRMTDISANQCLTNWLSGVAASGDFYCDPSLNIGSGANGIPSGWTRYNLDGTPY